MGPVRGTFTNSYGHRLRSGNKMGASTGIQLGESTRWHTIQASYPWTRSLKRMLFSSAHVTALQKGAKQAAHKCLLLRAKECWQIFQFRWGPSAAVGDFVFVRPAGRSNYSLEGWKVVHSASPGKTQVVFVFLVILCILSVKPQSFCKLGEKSGQISWMTPNQYHEKMVFHHVHPIKSFLFWVSRVEFLAEENFVRKTHDLGWMVASLPRCLWTVWALIVNGVYLTTLQGCNNRWSTYPPKGIPPEIRPY